MGLSKKTKMLILLVAVVICGLLVVLIILDQVSKKTDGDSEETPISYSTTPVSSPDNVIDINDSNGEVYRYVTIASDDTLRLYTDEGISLIINLDHRNWNEIAVSPGGKFISAIGETTEGIFDLYIFDIEEESWRRATDFTYFGSGITSYLWQDSNTILFTQGGIDDSWLYSYKVSSVTEVIKLKQVQGLVQFISKDGSKLILLDSDINLYLLYSNTGELLYSLKDIVVGRSTLPESNNVSYPVAEQPDSTEYVIAEKVIFSTNSEKLILSDGIFNFKHLFGSREAFRVNISRGFEPICAFTEDLMLGYKLGSEGNIEFYYLNVKDETEEYIDQIKINNTNLSTDLWSCYENNRVLVDVFIGGKTKWFENISEGKFNSLTFLDNAKEVKKL